MSRQDLIDLFLQSGCGPIPSGYFRGTALFYPGTWRITPISMITRLIWQGKSFVEGRPDRIRNRWFGIHMILGKCFIGDSLLDQKPCIVLEYDGVSRIFDIVRDELREVRPGLLLGRLYFRRPTPHYIGHFALEQKQTSA